MKRLRQVCNAGAWVADERKHTAAPMGRGRGTREMLAGWYEARTLYGWRAVRDETKHTDRSDEVEF